MKVLSLSKKTGEVVPGAYTAAQVPPAWSLIPALGCTLAFITCILLSVTPVFNMNGLDIHNRISIKLAWFGKWLPSDLKFTKDYYVSRQNTGYLELMLLLALMFVAYILCAFLINRQQGAWQRLRALIWAGVLVGGCIYLFTPGSLSSDIYSYGIYGRLLGVHFANPYFVPPSAFPHDPLYSLVYWRNTVSVYGPIWTVVCALLALLGGTYPLHLIMAFRAFAFAAHLCNIVLVVAILRALGRSPRIVTLGMLLYAWNPLVLVESSLGGHNDVFMVTFILLGLLYSARAERNTPPQLLTYIVPLIAFTMAALVKFSALPVIAVFILMLLCRTLRPMDQRSVLSRWRSALVTSLLACCISGGLALGLYGLFWVGHSLHQITESFTSQPSATVAWNSLLYTIDTWHMTHAIPPAFMFLLKREPWNLISLLATMCPILAGCILLWRTPDTRTVALVSLASLGAFLVVTPWFFAWYVTWIVGLAVVCLPVARDRLGVALLAFTLTISAMTFLTYYSIMIGWLLLSFHPPRVGWAVLVCLGAFGIPLLVFFACLLLWPLFRRMLPYEIEVSK